MIAPEQPLVSAVIPVYNCERFVADAVKSVLAQTYRPVECVVVDDGSTDGTPRAVRDFGDAVRYVRSENRGVASARNLGVDRAQGEFVAFLDADDIWLPEKLERQMALVRAQRGVGLVYSAISLVDERLRPLGQIDAAPPELALRNTLLLERPFATVASTGLLPVEVFHAVGGFDQRLSTSADCDLTCRVAYRYPVARIPEPLAQHRCHGTQMSMNLELFEHDMLLILEKLFSDDQLPRDVAALQDRAHANLQFALAVGHWRQGRRTKSLSHLSAAWRRHPRRASYLALQAIWPRGNGRPPSTRSAGRGHSGSQPRRPRLVMFVPGYSDPGGAARRSRLLASALTARGWDVRVISRVVTRRRFSVRRSENLAVLEVPTLPPGPLGTVLFLGVGVPLGLLWGARAKVFVAVQLVSPATAAALCSALARRPYLALATTSGQLSEAAYLANSRFYKLRRAMLRKAAFIGAQTEEVAGELREALSSDRVVVVPNAVEPAAVSPLTGTPHVLYTGRLSEEKDLLRLVLAWRVVAARREGALLTLAGSGGAYRSVEDELRRVVSNDPALRRTVRFTGWVADVGALLATADVYVLPSLSEGMSNSLLEACASRRVVVASDIPSNRSVVGEDYPLLFRAGDTASLVRTMERALDDEGTRARAVESVSAAIQALSVDVVVSRLENLIDAATDRPRH